MVREIDGLAEWRVRVEDDAARARRAREDMAAAGLLAGVSSADDLLSRLAAMSESEPERAARLYSQWLTRVDPPTPQPVPTMPEVDPSWLPNLVAEWRRTPAAAQKAVHEAAPAVAEYLRWYARRLPQ